MSCDNCQPVDPQYETYKSVIQKAALYAKDRNIFVGIYAAPDQPGGFGFTELPAPGLPILDIISPNFRLAH